MTHPKLQWEDPFAAEHNLLERVAGQLSDLLGHGWKVDELNGVPGEVDAMWRIFPPGGGNAATVVVDAKLAGVTPRLGPRLAARLEGARELIGNPSAARLVVAPYLSPRSRQVLDNLDVNYIDTTGNVSLRLQDPLVVLRTEGAQTDPAPRRGGQRGMSGPRAGRLIRDLVDRQPPRRGNELASSTELSESYVSRLLEVFSEEALIRRRQRVVTEVDWQGLLRARASSYELMKANHIVPAIARRGVEQTIKRLRDSDSSSYLATGTIAANGFAPLVVGGALLLYVPTTPRAVDAACKELGLMRIEQQGNADVLLLQPMSHGVFDRPYPRQVDGVPIAGLSQVVLDCLSGPGRLPAAGEELISWMERNEPVWREESPLTGTASLD